MRLHHQKLEGFLKIKPSTSNTENTHVTVTGQLEFDFSEHHKTISYSEGRKHHDMTKLTFDMMNKIKGEYYRIKHNDGWADDYTQINSITDFHPYINKKLGIDKSYNYIYKVLSGYFDDRFGRISLAA
jgi:hypothetical protein